MSRLAWRGLALALWIAAGAAAGSPLTQSLERAAGKLSADPLPCAAPTAETATASIQYLPELGQLLAWRSVEGDPRACVELDWPERRTLSARQALGLRVLLAAHDAAGGDLPAQTALADIEAADRRAARLPWLPPAALPTLADQPGLPWCPRTANAATQVPLQLPARVAPLLVRVRPHRCVPGARPLAGSGVMIAPDLALTAAHVVLAPTGRICDRYRVVPGGRRYSDPPAAPYGIAYVSRAFLSERGGWRSDAAVAPELNADYPARTAHDHALLMLDRPIALPAAIQWPRLRYASTALAPGLRVLGAGYASIGPLGRIAPGVAVNLYGQTACPRAEAEPYARFALWMAPGSSGGPIWRWPDHGQPLELLSLAVRLETLGEHQFETLGPRFDAVDYRRLLALLAQH